MVLKLLSSTRRKNGSRSNTFSFHFFLSFCISLYFCKPFIKSSPLFKTICWVLEVLLQSETYIREMFPPLILWGSKLWGRQWFMWGQHCWRQQMEAKCNKNTPVLYFSLHSRDIPDYLLPATSECLVEQGCSLSQWSETNGRMEFKTFSWLSKKDTLWIGLRCLLFTCASQKDIQRICWNQEMAGIVKSSCHRCLVSYDLTVEGQAVCSTFSEGFQEHWLLLGTLLEHTVPNMKISKVKANLWNTCI